MRTAHLLERLGPPRQRLLVDATAAGEITIELGERVGRAAGVEQQPPGERERQPRLARARVKVLQPSIDSDGRVALASPAQLAAALEQRGGRRRRDGGGRVRLRRLRLGFDRIGGRRRHGVHGGRSRGDGRRRRRQRDDRRRGRGRRRPDEQRGARGSERQQHAGSSPAPPAHPRPRPSRRGGDAAHRRFDRTPIQLRVARLGGDVGFERRARARAGRRTRGKTPGACPASRDRRPPARPPAPGR